jgi:hypothetical protein
MAVPTPDPALLLSEGGNYHAGGWVNGVGMNGPLDTELAPDVSVVKSMKRDPILNVYSLTTN